MDKRLPRIFVKCLLVGGLGVGLAGGLLTGCDRYSTPPRCEEHFARGDMGRFQPDSPGIAMDPRNGLRWYRCNAGERFANGQCIGEPLKLSLADTQRYIEEFATMTNRKWRLPTLDEMGTLIEKSCGNPALNPTAFPGAMSDNYWTSNAGRSARLGCTVFTFNGNSYCREDADNRRPFMLVLE
jgi:hypothetical protein